jgi:hypothetical protein
MHPYIHVIDFPVQHLPLNQMNNKSSRLREKDNRATRYTQDRQNDNTIPDIWAAVFHQHDNFPQIYIKYNFPQNL